MAAEADNPNPDPPTPTLIKPPYAGQELPLTQRLQAFYSIHNPTKVHDGSIEQLAEAFEDREDALNQALMNQYQCNLNSLA